MDRIELTYSSVSVRLRRSQPGQTLAVLLGADCARH